jgi:hypothetical protein
MTTQRSSTTNGARRATTATAAPRAGRRTQQAVASGGKGRNDGPWSSGTHRQHQRAHPESVLAAREPRSASDREALAPLGAAGGDHRTATTGLHAYEKAVSACAFDFGGLVSAFGSHCSSLAVATSGCGSESAGVVRDRRRFIARVSSRMSSSLFAEAPRTASRTKATSRKRAASPADEGRGEKRGIRRDAARHCQTGARRPGRRAGREAFSGRFRWTNRGIALWISPLCSARSNLPSMAERIPLTVSARYLRTARSGADSGTRGRRLAGATACG